MRDPVRDFVRPGDEHEPMAAADQPAEQVADLGPAGRVEAHERVVEDQQFRVR